MHPSPLRCAAPQQCCFLRGESSIAFSPSPPSSYPSLPLLWLPLPPALYLSLPLPPRLSQYWSCQLGRARAEHPRAAPRSVALHELRMQRCASSGQRRDSPPRWWQGPGASQPPPPQPPPDEARWETAVGDMEAAMWSDALEYWRDGSWRT